MTKPATETPEVRAVEDMAWDVKDAAADLYGRVLSGPDKAALACAHRDLERIRDRLLALRDKRRRGNGPAESDVPVPEPEP